MLHILLLNDLIGSKLIIIVSLKFCYVDTLQMIHIIRVDSTKHSASQHANLTQTRRITIKELPQRIEKLSQNHEEAKEQLLMYREFKQEEGKKEDTKD